jgi:hypothetical protein
MFMLLSGLPPVLAADASLADVAHRYHEVQRRTLCWSRPHSLVVWAWSACAGESLFQLGQADTPI